MPVVEDMVDDVDEDDANNNDEVLIFRKYVGEDFLDN